MALSLQTRYLLLQHTALGKPMCNHPSRRHVKKEFRVTRYMGSTACGLHCSMPLTPARKRCNINTDTQDPVLVDKGLPLMPWQRMSTQAAVLFLPGPDMCR